MDTSTIVKYGLASLLSFVFFIAVSYAIYPHVNGSAKKEKINNAPAVDEPVDFIGKKYDPDLYGPDAVARLKKQIDDMEQLISELREKENQYKEVIDSLAVVASSIHLQMVVEQEQRINAEGILEAASSLLELNDDVLSKILIRLEDQQLVELYHAAGRIQRGKLLRSLDPDRAAKLLKQVIS